MDTSGDACMRWSRARLDTPTMSWGFRMRLKLGLLGLNLSKRGGQCTRQVWPILHEHPHPAGYGSACRSAAGGIPDHCRGG